MKNCVTEKTIDFPGEERENTCIYGSRNENKPVPSRCKFMSSLDILFKFIIITRSYKVSRDCDQQTK